MVQTYLPSHLPLSGIVCAHAGSVRLRSNLSDGRRCSRRSGQRSVPPFQRQVQDVLLRPHSDLLLESGHRRPHDDDVDVTK